MTLAQSDIDYYDFARSSGISSGDASAGIACKEVTDLTTYAKLGAKVTSLFFEHHPEGMPTDEQLVDNIGHLISETFGVVRCLAIADLVHNRESGL